jgi:hypothetical protein
MTPFRPQPPKLPVRERASFRLASLFIGTFIGMMILLIASAVFGSLADSQRANAEAEIQPAPLVIDPKIQSDLSKAMSFDAEPPAVEVQNPFIDRAGLTGTAGITTGTVGGQQASISNTTAGNLSASTGSHLQSGTTQSGVIQVGPPVVSDTRSRHDEWMRRLQAGEYTGPESETLAVEDLIPVGYASGGNKPEEVMFYSPALCTTFSFPAGTRFYNGWLMSLDQNEVVFGFGNGIRRKSYSQATACAPTQGQQAMN